MIHVEDASSVADCQYSCTNFDGCNFYSFDGTMECLMFDTCPTVDETICPDCISGSPGCENNEDGNHAMFRHIIVLDPITIDSRVFSDGHWWLCWRCN